MTQAFKIRLTGPGGQLVLEASSPVTEQRQAMYTGFDIVHLPTNIHSFKNTSSRKWTVTGKLVSRTKSEAQANSRYLDLVRNWLLPDFGNSGATPPILRFFAYSNKNINNRKVVITSYDWTFSDEVDYIYTASQPMPVIGQLTINLEEVYSAEEITSQAWKLEVADGGEFAPGQNGSSSSRLDITAPSALMQQLGKANLQPSGAFNTVSNQLQKNITPTLAGVIAGQLTRSLGSKVINSPQVQAVISRVPAFARNIFVAGANAVASDISRVATQRVSQVTTAKPPTDPFSEAPPLPPQTVIG